MTLKQRLRWIALAIVPVELLLALLALLGLAFVALALPRPGPAFESRAVTSAALVRELPADDAVLVEAIRTAVPQATDVRVERLDPGATLELVSREGWKIDAAHAEAGLLVRWRAADQHLFAPVMAIQEIIFGSQYHGRLSAPRLTPEFGAPVAEPGDWLPSRITGWYLLSQLPPELDAFMAEVNARRDVRVVSIEVVTREAALAHDPETFPQAWDQARPGFEAPPVLVRIVSHRAERTDFDPLQYEFGRRDIRSVPMGMEFETDFSLLSIPPAWTNAAQLGLPLLLIASAALLLRWRRRDFADLAPPPPVPRLFLAGLLALAALAAIQFLAGWLLPASAEQAVAYAERYRFDIFLGNDPGFAGIAFAVLLMPLAEELLYRKWMLTYLAKAMPPSAAIGLGALLFAAIHLPMSAGHWVALLGMGVVFGTLWRRTRSLLVCWAVHAANNAVAVTWLLDMPGAG